MSDQYWNYVKAPSEAIGNIGKIWGRFRNEKKLAIYGWQQQQNGLQTEHEKKKMHPLWNKIIFHRHWTPCCSILCVCRFNQSNKLYQHFVFRKPQFINETIMEKGLETATNKLCLINSSRATSKLDWIFLNEANGMNKRSESPWWVVLEVKLDIKLIHNYVQ